MQSRNIYAFVYAFAGKNIPISNKQKAAGNPAACTFINGQNTFRCLFWEVLWALKSPFRENSSLRITC